MAEQASTHANDNSAPAGTKNRPDEWKIEQGLAGAKLAYLDQTGDVTTEIPPAPWPEMTKDEAAIKSVGDRDELFQRERKGWKG